MTSPAVRMLWEAVDPDQTLKERFGFPDAAATVRWLSDTLPEFWDVEVDGCEQIVMSAGNLLAWIGSGDRRLIAKWSINPQLFRHLADTAALAGWAQVQGIPAAAPIPAHDGRRQVETGSISIGLYPVMTGELLDTEDPAQVATAGHLLARLHQLLAGYPAPIDGARPPPGRQLVHNDIRAANLLYDGSGISAVLDFEEATYSRRVADLAKAAVLLSTRYHRWQPTTPAVRAAFIAAYSEAIPLSGAEQVQLQEDIASVLKHMNWA